MKLRSVLYNGRVILVLLENILFYTEFSSLFLCIFNSFFSCIWGLTGKSGKKTQLLYVNSFFFCPKKRQYCALPKGTSSGNLKYQKLYLIHKMDFHFCSYRHVVTVQQQFHILNFFNIFSNAIKFENRSFSFILVYSSGEGRTAVSLTNFSYRNMAV